MVLPPLRLAVIAMIVRLLACGVVLLTTAAVAYAQHDSLQVNDDAEHIFRQALDAFEQGDYGMAYRRFRLVREMDPPHRKTTAAWLMGGKALFRAGDYAACADLMDRFLRDFGTSGYVDEATRLRDRAREQETLGPIRTFQIGVLFSLNSRDVGFTHDLVSGIRLAVEEHNRIPGQRQVVRLVFRDTGNSAQQAAAAVADLVAQQVDAIIGPLYSEEAEAAADAAEQAGVVLLAPLATDEAVAAGKRYVFQMNPTIALRGRVLAHFAINDLRLHTFGIVAQRNSVSERVAESFRQEAERQGANVGFHLLIDRESDWRRLHTLLTADTLATVRAVFMPFGSSTEAATIDQALTSLDRLDTFVRLLGNSEWHDLPPATATKASAYQSLYTQDFLVNPNRPEVQAFGQTYRNLTRHAPERLSYYGYDVTRFLLSQLTRPGPRTLVEALHTAPPWQGLGMEIVFGDGNVNQALFYLQYQPDGLTTRIR
jgi:ABC-type branched-subunit amino acid transport system substrate-binding protein